MNEVIVQAAEQAAEYAVLNLSGEALQSELEDGTMVSIPREFVEKFAELIVQTCVQVVKDNTPFPDEDVSIEDWDKGYIRAMSDCVYYIKEYFEVEE